MDLKCSAAIIYLLTLATGLPSQNVTLFAFGGQATNQRMGTAVRFIGDTDGDGVPEFVVADTSNGWTPRMTVFSGATGTPRYDPLAVPPLLGHDIENIGDVNGDLLDDWAIGFADDNAAGTSAGRVDVRSGLNGQIIRSHFGLSIFSRLGWRVANVGDLDGDGVSEMAVSAPSTNQWNAPNQIPIVDFYSGATGALYFRLSGSPSSLFGYEVESVGDVNADGRPDVGISTRLWTPVSGGAWEPGKVDVFSGATGVVLHSIQGLNTDSWIGHMAATGDMNMDGYGDFLVSSGGESLTPGYVSLRSGLDGSEIWNVSRYHHYGEYDWFGHAIAVAGDLDGDGAAEVLVGAPQPFFNGSPGPGYVSIINGATGVEVVIATGSSPSDEFGWSLDVGPDLTGDGFPEYIVGIRKKSGTAAESGAVEVRSLLSMAFHATPHALSAGTGGTHQFFVDLPQYAGLPYTILGTLSGTTPGVAITGGTIPLNPDPYFWMTALQPNVPPLAGTLGLLNGQGIVQATLTIPPLALPNGTALIAHHVVVVTGLQGSVLAISRPTPLTITP